jgi:predicted metalloendopeptidase
LKQYLLSALTLSLIASFSNASDLVHKNGNAPISAKNAGKQLVSGIETRSVDPSVRAQDDFFQHLNAKWLSTTDIPADKPSWGSFTKVYDDTQSKLLAIIESSAKDESKAAGSDAQRIGDFYASFMDEKKIEALGMTPIAAEMANISALTDKQDIAALMARMTKIRVNLPFIFDIHQDAKDSTKYVADIYQDGLGMPDRDYYLKENDAKLADTRAKYQLHVARMLELNGDMEAATNAKAIVALETALAKAQWTRVESRDPVKTYNKVELDRLSKLVAGFDWPTYLRDTGIAGKTGYVIVSQPSYLKDFGDVLAATPLATWKAYFKWQLLRSYADFLPKNIVEQQFIFYGSTLSGATEMRPRWQRAVSTVEGALGESIGKLYVEKYFPPSSKARMEELVKNLITAYSQSISELGWMSPETKKEAQAKLAKLMPKIGYPDKWRDYSMLAIAQDDLVGNVMRARELEYHYELNKLGKPVDRAEWGTTPQTVNAYYNPEHNTISFPAAILQPPFFNAGADDAANYGAIGAVIGHEISHGFDDHGAEYDANGNLRNWWTVEDREKYVAKTKMLIAQYSAFSPLPGYQVNGELTLGENIADNSGVAIAYKAYRLSLKGKNAPVIDGLTGAQRFYMAFGQVWRIKMREQEQIARIKTDGHSPGKFRANGSLRNQPGFHDAFNVKKGDKMYLAPQERVIIW